MLLEAIAVEQSFSLATNATTNFLRLRMPNHAELVLNISDEDLKRVLEANGDLSPGTNDEAAPDVSEPALIPWQRIPDDSLPAAVKTEFARWGMPEHMTIGDIAFHAHRILSSDKMASPTPVGEEDHDPVKAQHSGVDDETGVPQV